jgi:carbonic anhydrase
MDARIDPAAAFGIALGDAHVIRNAGGNAQDALRSILTSQHLLGTREIVLVKHTGCGMLTFSNEDGRAALQGNGGEVEDGFDFQPFDDLQDALRRDVEFLKGHEGLARDVPVPVSGWVYDVATGRVERIV